MSATRSLSQLKLAFLGCGKISSAVCRGYAGADPPQRPAKIVVSQRSAAKSSALAADFPGLVTIAATNEEVIAGADVVFIGLLPGVAREQLPLLQFTPQQLIISMMAAVDYEETLHLTRLPSSQVVRTVPLPAAARRSGPLLLYPPHAQAQQLLSAVAAAVVSCSEERDMKPMISLTGHISSFFELMNTSQNFITSQGVDAATARQFVTSFYASLASGAEQSSESLEELSEEAATPGGLNEQTWNALKKSDHFALQHESMQSILDRLNGK